MRRSFSFHPEARSELRAAVEYYESRSRGVGAELLGAVRHAIEQVVTHPDAGTPGRSGTRRALLLHFPYSLIYLPDEHEITIIALAHERRRPGYWRARTQ